MDHKYNIDTLNPQMGPIVLLGDSPRPFLTVYYPVLNSEQLGNTTQLQPHQIDTSGLCHNNQSSMIMSYNFSPLTAKNHTPGQMSCGNDSMQFDRQIQSPTAAHSPQKSEWSNTSQFGHCRSLDGPWPVLLGPLSSNVLGTSPCKSNHVGCNPFIASYSATIEPPERFGFYGYENTIVPSSTSTPPNQRYSAIHSMGPPPPAGSSTFESPTRIYNQSFFTPSSNLHQSLGSPDRKAGAKYCDTPVPQPRRQSPMNIPYSFNLSTSTKGDRAAAPIRKKFKRGRTTGRVSKL